MGSPLLILAHTTCNQHTVSTVTLAHIRHLSAATMLRLYTTHLHQATILRIIMGTAAVTMIHTTITTIITMTTTAAVSIIAMTATLIATKVAKEVVDPVVELSPL